MAPSRVTTSPRPTSRRSPRFCLAWPRWAIGGFVVGAVDEGREVRHVQRQARQVQAELGDHRGADGPFGGGQLVGVELVHGVPEPAVIGRCYRHFGEPRTRGACPPLLSLIHISEPTRPY